MEYEANYSLIFKKRINFEKKTPAIFLNLYDRLYISPHETLFNSNVFVLVLRVKVIKGKIFFSNITVLKSFNKILCFCFFQFNAFLS